MRADRNEQGGMSFFLLRIASVPLNRLRKRELGWQRDVMRSKKRTFPLVRCGPRAFRFVSFIYIYIQDDSPFGDFVEAVTQLSLQSGELRRRKVRDDGVNGQRRGFKSSLTLPRPYRRVLRARYRKRT